jgi:hypothetical protein
VDQNAGTVKIAHVTGPAEGTFENGFDAASGAVGASANGVYVQLSEPPAEGGGSAALKFEGGAF